MKKNKALFILSIGGILFLLALLPLEKPIKTGIVDSIKSAEGKTTINLSNSSEIILILDYEKINLRKDDMIFVYGKKDVYDGKTWIYPDKIVCKNCG